jgi:hypothetical protein
MPVRRRDVDRQRDAVFVNGEMDFDAPDLLSTIDCDSSTIDFDILSSPREIRRLARGIFVISHSIVSPLRLED